MILVTGGCGFIGSNFILKSLSDSSVKGIVNVDKLTYSGHLENLKQCENDSRYHFIQADINDKKLIYKLLKDYQIQAVVNFAAESHVDNSIHNPEIFITTNILGTFNLLEASRQYWNELNEEAKKSFKFLHVSTDEVFGSLAPEDPAFHENTAFAPNSPYSASKAGSDHLVRAWHHTYGLPTLTTNCTNNYGPYQFPEKLIPLTIFNALHGLPITIYGDGKQIRDWLFVQDHCNAIHYVLSKGIIGETYAIGGWNQKTNLEIVTITTNILDELVPKKQSYTELISFVKDRPGHDRRYAINASKIKNTLGWQPSETFETGIRKTIEWYLENTTWLEKVLKTDYLSWKKSQIR